MVLTRARSVKMAVSNETLQLEIQKMSQNIKQRLDILENGLTEKIKEAVNEMINMVKEELNEKILALGERVRFLEQNRNVVKDDRSLSFVVYDMAESEEEDVTEKVNHLLASQLKLGNVHVTEAERKPKPEGKDAGVIVAKCSNVKDKALIMQSKSTLKNSTHFSHIRIYPDKPKWQRQQEANVRLLVKSLGENKLYLRGNRVCTKDGQQQQVWQNNANRGQGHARSGQGRGPGRTGRGHTTTQA